MDEGELESLLALDGATFEMAPGIIVEFTARLKRFALAGIVAFKDGPHRTRVPALIARRVHLDIDLACHQSAVALDTIR
jgi:hypothetical protein